MKGISRSDVAIGISALALLAAGLNSWLDYSRYRESKPHISLTFAQTIGNEGCMTIGFNALNASSSPVTLVRPSIELHHEPPPGGGFAGWGFSLVRLGGERPKLVPGGSENVSRDQDQPTYLAPGEAARYRQVITPYMARRMLLPEWRYKPIDLEIHDFEGHTWRLANTESPTTLAQVSVTGTLTPPGRQKCPFFA